MKKIFFQIAVFISLAMPKVLAASSEIRQVDYPPTKVEVASAYTSGAPVNIKLRELFPHSCYKAGPTDVHVNGTDVFVRNTAFLYDGYLCLAALYPHEKVVSLGDLPNGRYRLWINAPGAFRQEADFVVLGTDSRIDSTR